ncbi:MAG: MetQ/NlpA family ABC transporter substrate-binding protein [Sulfurospirillaceae bacterium]|jgi:D-methionine transport system substrate-binding protein|nr:MetQ/NlpA family ABC transporter substrate-binding protein [Sulfurospirillaceae bacterium]MCK9545638.1 MetQ/NlpA family ABC transporter substrate-binding protein [Sulfurospirillaceae bacterium]NLN00073.1 MetQ/NlpA family ABC transporter substrate-binding protein [Campylobacteraceae bacterium]
MKRKLFLLSFLVAVPLLAKELITVGATPVPHAQILEFVKPILAKEGYELKIQEFNDYVIPNMATQDGEVDANFFQHMPYLEEFNKNHKTNLVKTVSVHLEPMGVYSSSIKSLDELKEKSKVSVPNDPTNENRALEVLESNGLIKLNDTALKTPLDIVENPKKLRFIEIEAAQLPRTLNDVSIAVINTNFALSAGLNPTNDALAMESIDSPYANILVVKAGNEKNPKIVALGKALNSPEVKEYILKAFKGEIIPAF